MENQLHSVRLIGPGRAGKSLATALESVGWPVIGMLSRADSLAGAASGADLLVIATPDDSVARVASAVDPVGSTVVVHLSGSLGLEVLSPHQRVASMHPLVPLPSPGIGAKRLLSGVRFAVAGDPLAAEMVGALGGKVIEVADADRDAYHAAACVASNHLVALLGQVERLASRAGLHLEDFLELACASLEDVQSLGPAGALTGPAARGDFETLYRHREVMSASGFASADLAAYDACAELAQYLANGSPGGSEAADLEIAWG
ncbi:MAG: DUF2520 domain-containing protein [Acidimicrobiales bacterium]